MVRRPIPVVQESNGTLRLKLSPSSTSEYAAFLMKSPGEIHAWHVATGNPIRMQISRGLISRIETVAEPPPKAQWVAPGLLDVQVNGYAGVDFQQDNLTIDSLLVAVRGLRKAGCTR